MPKEPVAFKSSTNIIYVALQVLVSILFVSLYFIKAPFTTSELTEFSTVVTSTPKQTRDTGDSWQIEFSISGSTYDVSIRNASLNALGGFEKLQRSIHVGDSIYLSINKLEYLNVIVKGLSKSPFSGNKLEVYTLRTPKTKYIELWKVNHYKKKDEFLGAIFGVLLFILVLISLYKKLTLVALLEKHGWIFIPALILLVIFNWYAFKV